MLFGERLAEMLLKHQVVHSLFEGILTPRCFAAALLTIGVSSEQSPAKAFLMSSLICDDTFAYAGAYKAADDVRDVNHSPRVRRVSRGM
jgi:hypothetical protein